MLVGGWGKCNEAKSATYSRCVVWKVCSIMRRLLYCHLLEDPLLEVRRRQLTMRTLPARLEMPFGPSHEEPDHHIYLASIRQSSFKLLEFNITRMYKKPN